MYTAAQLNAEENSQYVVYTVNCTCSEMEIRDAGTAGPKVKIRQLDRVYSYMHTGVHLPDYSNIYISSH